MNKYMGYGITCVFSVFLTLAAGRLYLDHYMDTYAPKSTKIAVIDILTTAKLWGERGQGPMVLEIDKEISRLKSNGYVVFSSPDLLAYPESSKIVVYPPDKKNENN